MGDWIIPCDCCGQTIKKVKNPDGYAYSNQNQDGTPHQKHHKIWVTSVVSFLHYKEPFQKLDPDTNLGDLTVKDLDDLLDYKLNLRFGQYYHGQSGHGEIWLDPRRFDHGGVDYYVSGSIAGIEDDDTTMVDLKTTWVSSKTRMAGVVEKARAQANLYAWVGGFTLARIVVKNLAKPALDVVVDHVPDTSGVEAALSRYVDHNKDAIKTY